MLLEPFGKDQLIELLKEAALKNPALVARISATAQSDPSHRKIFVHGLGWDATTESLATSFVPYGEIEECKAVLDRATGRCKVPHPSIFVFGSCNSRIDPLFAAPDGEDAAVVGHEVEAAAILVGSRGGGLSSDSHQLEGSGPPCSRLQGGDAIAAAGIAGNSGAHHPFDGMPESRLDLSARSDVVQVAASGGGFVTDALGNLNARSDRAKSSNGDDGLAEEVDVEFCAPPPPSINDFVSAAAKKSRGRGRGGRGSIECVLEGLGLSLIISLLRIHGYCCTDRTFTID